MSVYVPKTYHYHCRILWYILHHSLFICISVYEATKIQVQMPQADDTVLKCRFCAKLFVCQSYLERHLLQHTGEKPFRCKYCARRFTRQTTADKHVITMHGFMNFQCDKCGEYFASRREYNIHVELCHGIRKDGNWNLVEKRMETVPRFCHFFLKKNIVPWFCHFF